MRSLIILSGIMSVFLGGLVLTTPISVLAQTDERPLILPMAEEPGLNTWLFGQPYGNTVTAYNTGSRQYSAGQGLHFGLDFSMPCVRRWSQSQMAKLSRSMTWGLALRHITCSFAIPS